MSRWVILASVVSVAAMSGACAEMGQLDSANGLTSPSGFSASSAPTGKGGNGKGNGPGGGGGGGNTANDSHTLAVQMVADGNGDGLPNWGDSVTFDASSTATAEPHVGVSCSQNGAVVYGAVTGFFASYPWPWTQTMTLQSISWQGGAADCTARLYYIDVTQVIDVASISFSVGE